MAPTIKRPLEKPKSRIGRKIVLCPIFGNPSQLPIGYLPKNSQVINYFNHLQNESIENTGKELSRRKIANIIAQELSDCWKTLDQSKDTECKSKQEISRLVYSLYENYRGKIKKIQSNQDRYQSEIETYKLESENNEIKFANTNLSKTQKRKEVRLQSLNNKRMKQEQQEKDQQQRLSEFIQMMEEEEEEDESECESNSESTDPSFIYEPKLKNVSTQMRTMLTNLTIECDRFGLSDRAASFIATAVLIDLGIITDEDKSQVITRSKVQRAREKVRQICKIRDQTEAPPLDGFSIDGRKNDINCQLEIDGQNRQSTRKQEQIVIAQEPNSSYIGHVTVSSGSSESIFNELVHFFNEENIDFTGLKTIGSDGAPVNTGCDRGIIRRFEEYLGRPLQWNICMLHANEIPLKDLFEHLDGTTNSPNSYSGPLGKKMAKIGEIEPKTNKRYEFQVIKYKTIYVPNFPVIETKSLSTDQKYLYDMCLAVINGKCSIELANRKPGKLSHARWLTLANRILRLYVSEKKPSKKLIILANYVVQVYSQVWFRTKLNSTCDFGARNLFNLIESSRFLQMDERKIVQKAIARNAFYAHPESILLSMLTDPRSEIRKMGIERILQSRQQSNDELRQFKVPKLVLNFDATDYSEMLHWDQLESWTEPPLTIGLTVEQLKIYKTPLFPCHCQGTERCVRLVTEAARKVTGYKRRDGFIRMTNDSRRRNKLDCKKSEFNLSNLKV